MHEFVLQLNHVTVRRGGQARPVLDDIHLQFRRGELVTICGHNGAGKTTLARALVGLFPLAGGEIVVDPAASRKDSTHESGENGNPLNIQMVFQPPLAQLIGDTIFEELAMTASQRWPEWNRAQVVAAVSEACAQLGLHHLPLDTSVHRLSGGQLQRLCVAQALLSGAQVLVFDEALSALDLAARAHLRQRLRAIVEETGTTVLMITHDMEDVLEANRVIVLANGRVCLDTSPTSFFYDPAGTSAPCTAWGFDVPFLVQAAHAYNLRTARTINPCNERQFVEALCDDHVDTTL